MTAERKKGDDKDPKQVIRQPASTAAAESVVAVFNQLLKDHNITPKDYAAQADFWREINPIIAQAFNPMLDALFPMRTGKATDQTRKSTGEFLTVPDLARFARVDKATQSIFKEGFKKAKENETERMNAILMGADSHLQFLQQTANQKSMTAVAMVFYHLFSGTRKKAYKEGQIVFTESRGVAIRILADKVIEQRILMHAFALDEKRTEEKICSKDKIAAVIAEPDTEFSMYEGRMQVKLALSQQSMLHLAQLFNAYYPSVEARVEYVLTQYFSGREPTTYILSVDCREFLKQALPVMMGLATKPAPTGDLTKEPDPKLLKDVEFGAGSGIEFINFDRPVYRG